MQIMITVNGHVVKAIQLNFIPEQNRLQAIRHRDFKLPDSFITTVQTGNLTLNTFYIIHNQYIIQV